MSTSFAGSGYAPYGQPCPLFSPYNLTFATLEDEFFVTTRCENALLRFGTLVALVLVEFLTMVAAVFVFLWPLFQRCFSGRNAEMTGATSRSSIFQLNVRTICLFLVSLASLGRVVVFLLGLFEIHNGLYQFLLGAPLCLINAASTIMIESWIKILMAHYAKGRFGTDNTVTPRLRIFLIVYNLFFTFGLILFWTCGSQLRFDPERVGTYNMLIALGLLWVALMSIVFAITALWAGQALVSYIQTTSAELQKTSADFDTSRMEYVQKKIRNFSWFAFIITLNASFGCIAFFIWWAIVHSQNINGDPTASMAYFFFPLYYLIMPMEIMGSWNLLLMLRPTKKVKGTSTPASGSSSKRDISGKRPVADLASSNTNTAAGHKDDRLVSIGNTNELEYVTVISRATPAMLLLGTTTSLSTTAAETSVGRVIIEVRSFDDEVNTTNERATNNRRNY